MADSAGAGELAGWIQTGGVVAFASAVLLWLRDHKREITPVLTELGKTLGTVNSTLSALLERERARAERLAAIDAIRRGEGVPQRRWNDDEDGNTQPIVVASKQGRARTEPGPGEYSVRGKTSG